MQSRLTQLLDFLAESPQDPFLKYALTMEYVKLDQPENARAGFEQLLQEHPDYVGTYYHYAKFLEKHHQKDLAISIYERGMQVAHQARNRHAYQELNAALKLAQGIDDEDWDD